MIKPIKPENIYTPIKENESLPDNVVQALNELIKKNYDGIQSLIPITEFTNNNTYDIVLYQHLVKKTYETDWDVKYTINRPRKYIPNFPTHILFTRRGC